MTWWELAAIALAGGAAGFINTVAGSGTLVTFPTLLAFGVPPVTANVSNNIGLVPGVGQRRDRLAPRAGRASGLGCCRLASASLVGGRGRRRAAPGAPAEAFGAIVPVLVGARDRAGGGPAVDQPAGRRRGGPEHADGAEPRDARWLWPAVAATGVYGGYFGAAQGILLMAVLGARHPTTPCTGNNALKNVLAGIVNGVAAVVFIIVGGRRLGRSSALIAVGSVVGAQVGARAGRRMPAALLRAFIIVVGVTALAVFLTR